VRRRRSSTSFLPRQDTHDQCAGEVLQGGEEEDEGGRVFPNEMSTKTLATKIVLRSSEEWALKRSLTMNTLEEAEKPIPQASRH
jgi:hypothetical protein